ncbi:LLM class F420-dependent oxidoreductase [Hoyosella sp. YIM 151337]|uniref:LLM class F420-dependent oxidoreductase n=1 Tax=Hoyosella sp. YIM 151337 TaxID=2992742 RepID=UPI002236BF71|nr:LLM class F420-dependent oxidoreductase [Hoyosella sp. YIM 151337]MCW4354823.1 LLM class F420-dependent oxidoreductase [Hoyosella sp. YIM 151337]
MDRPLRIGVQIQPQHSPDYALIRDAVLRAEDAEVDVVFNWDHFYPLYGEPDGPHFECWTMLAAWAEQTERVEFGALVTCGVYRNPDLLADMARTVDHISGGRLIFGIGSGWFQRDFDEYGYEFGTKVSRLNLLGEYLPRIEARFKKLNPPPTRHLPMLIGGGGVKKTLRLVARHADIWHSFGDIDTFTYKSGVLNDHCTAEGRDPSLIERSIEFPGVSEADDFVKAGASFFTVPLNGPDYDMAPVLEAIKWRDTRNG